MAEQENSKEGLKELPDNKKRIDRSSDARCKLELLYVALFLIIDIVSLRYYYFSLYF